MPNKIEGCERFTETRTAFSERKMRNYTLNRKNEHTEPFRAVLLDVMRKEQYYVKGKP